VNRQPRWIEEAFIEKADLFLKVLEWQWERAEEEAKLIANLLRKYGIKDEAKLLEVGCGNGRILINLAKLGYRTWGVDISPKLINDGIKKARERGVEGKVEFVICDVRELSKFFKRGFFDAVLAVWTSIIGYYLNDDVDVRVLKECRYVTKDGGHLFVLNTVNRDVLTLRHSLRCIFPSFEELDDVVLVEKPTFDPLTSTISNKWTFYKKAANKDLKYLGEFEFKLRVYSLHELINIAKRAGWKYVASYTDLTTLRDFVPSLSGFNLVFETLT